MVCFAIVTPFKSKQYHTDIFSIAQNAGIVNALPTKLRQCFFYGSFKSEPADHFHFCSQQAEPSDRSSPAMIQLYRALHLKYKPHCAQTFVHTLSTNVRGILRFKNLKSRYYAVYAIQAF